MSLTESAIEYIKGSGWVEPLEAARELVNLANTAATGLRTDESVDVCDRRACQRWQAAAASRWLCVYRRR